MTRLSGLVLMAISALAFSLMAMVIKELRACGLPNGEILFFRGLFCTAITVWALRSAGISLAGNRRMTLVLRGVCGLCGLYLYCEALGRIPLADAMALQYTHPMFAALLAWIFLSERLPKVAPLAMLVCAGGGLLILNPTGTGDLTGNIIGLLSGVVSGLAYTIVRSLGKSEHPLVIMLSFHVATLLFAAVSLLDAFVWPSTTAWLWIVALVTASQAGQWFLTHSLRKEKAGIATTVSYTAIAWGVLLGWLVFGEPIAWQVPAGTVLMVVGLTVLARGRSRST